MLTEEGPTAKCTRRGSNSTTRRGSWILTSAAIRKQTSKRQHPSPRICIQQKNRENRHGYHRPPTPIRHNPSADERRGGTGRCPADGYLGDPRQSEAKIPRYGWHRQEPP